MKFLDRWLGRVAKPQTVINNKPQETKAMASTFIQKENSAALFPNDRKRPEKNDPDWTGTATIVCEHCNTKSEVYLNAWAKEAGDKEYFSISIRPKAANGNTPEATAAKPTAKKIIKRPAAQPKP